VEAVEAVLEAAVEAAVEASSPGNLRCCCRQAAILLRIPLMTWTGSGPEDELWTGGSSLNLIALKKKVT